MHGELSLLFFVFPMSQFMVVRMLVRVIGPVLVHVTMRGTNRREFICFVSVRSAEVMVMIMTAPEVLRIIVGNQQTLAMMPASAEDVIVFLALRCSLILTQALPLTMWMLLDLLSHERRCEYTIARSLEEEAIVDIHQAIKAEPFIDPADFLQQFTAEGHQVALDSINVRPPRLLKLSQVFSHQSI